MAILDRFLNIRRGINGLLLGLLSTLHSTRIKRKPMTQPKTRRQMTVADLQGNVMPPNSRPRRNMRVPPMIVKAPSASTAFRPVRKDVLGL